MNYRKTFRAFALTLVLTLTIPAQAFAAVSDGGLVIPDNVVISTETPEAYELRTGYILPEGWHYILEEGFVFLYEDGTPLIEEDVEEEPSSEESEEEKTQAEESVSGAENSNSEETGLEEIESETTTPEEKEVQPEDTDSEPAEVHPEDTETESDEIQSEDTDSESVEIQPEGTKSELPEEDLSQSEISETDKSEVKKSEIEGNPILEAVQNKEQSAAEKIENITSGSSLYGSSENKSLSSYITSAQFSKLKDRIQYNVTVPIEGLPLFITQEMVIGALKCQDETGFPASVTIAQIIQESGFGSYGPGGQNGKGLSYLAYQYCNLFGIKGTGTAGSANLGTWEMTSSGSTYKINAAFRAYHTYTECIEDRTKVLQNGYSDLTAGVTDANTFAIKVGGRWATDLTYGQKLIEKMERYDLYRLDDMTLLDFTAMIGRFANPCPGAVITSTFGYRTFDNSFHKGLDLGTGQENIPTYAAEAGIVTFAGYSDSAGNMIIIDHGDGLVTKYMHHEEIYVVEGQSVTKGQQIGLTGSTGDSTGNHLHFQVEENGVAVDPLLYLQDDGNGKTIPLTQKEVKKIKVTGESFICYERTPLSRYIYVYKVVATKGIGGITIEEKSDQGILVDTWALLLGTWDNWSSIADSANSSTLYGDSILFCQKLPETA